LLRDDEKHLLFAVWVAIFDRYDPYAMTFNPHKMEVGSS
jgi:hypothetical protein